MEAHYDICVLSEMHYLPESKEVAGGKRHSFWGKKYKENNPTMEELKGWHKKAGCRW